MEYVNEIPASMGSDDDDMIVINHGVYISADKNGQSQAKPDGQFFKWPEVKGNLKSWTTWLYLAGGPDAFFKAVEIEVWGIN